MDIKYGFKGRPGTLADIQNCVGPGWHALLERLVNDIFALGWDGAVLQVKEKFGGLRFYPGSVNDAVHERIVEAERESYKTCEQCGAPGVLRQGGWLKTACDEHSDGRPPFDEDDQP